MYVPIVNDVCYGHPISHIPLRKELGLSRSIIRGIGTVATAAAIIRLASYPGIPIWRRGEEEHLVYIVVCMR